MSKFDSGANPALFRRIARVRGPIVRKLPDADVSAMSRRGRDATDLSPVMPLRVHEDWYAAYWYGDRPERGPSPLLVGLGLLREAAGALLHAMRGRAGKADGGLAGGHPAGAR